MIGKRFIGHSIVVTGAGQGIGKAVALRFAAEGAHVILVGRRRPLLEKAVDAIRARGGRASCQAADVSIAADVQSVIDYTIDETGRLDVLVNNAGVDDLTPFLQILEEEWDRVLGINLKGAFLMSQRAGREMANRDGGVILSISSIDAYAADGTAASYHASKAGLLALNRAMAMELAPYHVRANCISPGFTRTEMIEKAVGSTTAMDYILHGFERVPMRRLVQPDEVAAACAFLASSEASAITGIDLVVDCGTTANLYILETLPRDA